MTAGSPTSASAAPAPKRAWPLLLLAASAFVPGLGLFLGAAAVTWALVTNRPRRKLAVALGASGAVLNLAAPVVLMLTTGERGEFARVQSQLAQQDLTRLVAELEQYRIQTGHYPATLQILVGVPIPRRLINIYDRSRGPFVVPRPYEYHLSADGTSYDLFSAGPDGVPHTADDIRPVVADSLRERVGYQPAP